VCRDISERVQGEEALRQSEQLLRLVLNSLPVGVAVLDRAGDVVLGNPAWEAVWGGGIRSGAERYAKSRGWWHGSGEPIGPEEWPSFRAYSAGEATHGDLLDIEASDGTRRVIRNSAVPVRGADGAMAGAVILAEDITDRVRLEEQFHQAQKMEAIGRLAGGVAHDFNNLLTVIITYADLLLQEGDAGGHGREDLGEIRKAAESATALTRQLLAFSRQEVTAPRLVLLEEVVRGEERLLQRLIGEDVVLVTALTDPPSTVRIDPGHLEQIVMNLAINARDAMPAGGTLTLESGTRELDASDARAFGTVQAGPFATLAVRDTGVGMDAETQARIFEPFFTTKAPGKGTGLGLATVYGILERSGGFVAVQSAPGQGTTFEIGLPLVGREAAQAESRDAPADAARGTESILLVEDEAGVRAATRQALERYGYTVVEAPGSRVALDFAARPNQPIHLLLTDVVMPEMSGRELVERFVALRPETRVLYMSGYTDDAILRHRIMESGFAFLQKPYTPEALARKVREVLSAT
jgi:two-component system cell cycle sensor histidine kinase/response regulator CckA